MKELLDFTKRLADFERNREDATIHIHGNMSLLIEVIKFLEKDNNINKEEYSGIIEVFAYALVAKMFPDSEIYMDKLSEDIINNYMNIIHEEANKPENREKLRIK